MMHKNINTEWAKTLHNALKKEVEPVPKGFYTNKQVAQQLGVQVAQATKVLKELRSRGLCEVKNFRAIVNEESTLIRSVPHYRLIKK